MAGIGVRLNRIFEKNTLTTNMIGFFYSTLVTVAPMFAIIINLVLMEYFLKFSTLGYAQRELFSCTISLHIYFFFTYSTPFKQCYHDICQISFMKNVIRIFCHVII